MDPKRKRTTWAAVAIAVVVLGLGALLLRRGAKEPPRFETAAVDRGDVVVRVTASGTVSARRTVEVSSQVSGRVKELLTDFNARVKKGDLLARIDPQPFEAAVAQSQANAAAARANVEKARANVADLARQAARKKVLFERNLVAAEEWESAQAELDKARAEENGAHASLAQAKAALDTAAFNLSSTAIRSPIDGIVVSRAVDVGQTVAASLQAPTLFTLAEDLRLMQVQAHVSESDVGRITEGTAATFTVDAWPGEKVKASVRQVRNAATTTSSVVTYDVILDVENPALRLRPGMTANVTFVVAERRGVLRVPNAALRFHPPAPPAGAPPPGAPPLAAGGPPPAAAGASQGASQTTTATTSPAAADRKVLFVEAADGRLTPVPVKVGVTDGSYTEIVEGSIEAGARVATRDASAAATSTSSTRSETRSRQQGPGGPPPPRMF